jgi:hypothetical protein
MTARRLLFDERRLGKNTLPIADYLETYQRNLFSILVHIQSK